MLYDKGMILMISRLNPYYKILVIILIIFFIEKIAGANGNIRLISLDEAIRIGLKNNKTFLLRSESMSIAAQNTYLNAKTEYSRPSIDSLLSLSKKHELKVNAKQKFLIPKTGAVISLENNYKIFFKDRSEDRAETIIALTLSQPLSPKEILTNRRILRDIEDDYSLSLLYIKTIKETLIGEIVNNYINLIRQEMSIKRNRKRIETQEKLLIIADLKYKAGEIPKIDMMDLELQNKLDKINLLSEEDNYRKSKKDFLKLLGLDRETEFNIICDLPFLDSLPSIDDAIARAKIYQLAEAKVSLKRKEESLKEARLSKNLAVSLEAGYSIQLPFNSSEGERSDETQVGLKVEYKIYDGGIYKRGILQQQKELEMEQYNFQEMNKRIEDEVKEVYKEIDLMNNKREFLSSMERISHDLLEAAKLRFKMGVISQSELNNIVERYDKANEEIVDIEIESFLTGIRLLMFTGELSSHFIR